MSLATNYLSVLETKFANVASQVEHGDIVAGGTYASKDIHVFWDWIRRNGLKADKTDVIFPLPKDLLPVKCFITGAQIEAVNDGSALIINLVKRKIGGGSDTWSVIPNYQSTHRVLGSDAKFQGVALIPPLVGKPTCYGKTISQEEAFKLFHKLDCYPPSSVLKLKGVVVPKGNNNSLLYFSDMGDEEVEVMRNVELLKNYLGSTEARHLLARLVTSKIQNLDAAKEATAVMALGFSQEASNFLDELFDNEVKKHARFMEKDNVVVSNEYLEILASDLKFQESEKAVQINTDEEVGICIETADRRPFDPTQGFQAKISIEHLYAKIVENEDDE